MLTSTIAPAQVEAATATWMEGCQHIINQHWSRSGYTHAPAPVLAIQKGKRYLRIVNMERGQCASVYAFIDLENGNVLKPAGFKAPAKHARGNVLDENNGLKWMSHHGPAYLR